MKTPIRNFITDDQDQDLIEYALLMRPLLLFIGTGSISGILGITDTNLMAANTSTS